MEQWLQQGHWNCTWWCSRTSCVLQSRGQDLFWDKGGCCSLCREMSCCFVAPFWGREGEVSSPITGTGREAAERAGQASAFSPWPPCAQLVPRLTPGPGSQSQGGKAKALNLSCGGADFDLALWEGKGLRSTTVRGDGLVPLLWKAVGGCLKWNACWWSCCRELCL